MAAKAGSRPIVNIGNPFTYDFDDRLTGITAGATSTSYRYDALGRQVSRAVNGQLTGYYLDGDQMLLEKQGGGGANVAVYTWGNDLIRCNGEYPLTDGRGNVRLTTDGSRNVTSSNAPDAFGVASYTANTASAYLWNGGGLPDGEPCAAGSTPELLVPEGGGSVLRPDHGVLPDAGYIPEPEALRLLRRRSGQP